MANRPIKTAVPKLALGAKKTMKPLSGKPQVSRVSSSTSGGRGKRIVN